MSAAISVLPHTCLICHLPVVGGDNLKGLKSGYEGPKSYSKGPKSNYKLNISWALRPELIFQVTQ